VTRLQIVDRRQAGINLYVDRLIDVVLVPNPSQNTVPRLNSEIRKSAAAIMVMVTVTMLRLRLLSMRLFSEEQLLRSVRGKVSRQTIKTNVGVLGHGRKKPRPMATWRAALRSIMKVAFLRSGLSFGIGFSVQIRKIRTVL
jgi:hypothetical protein